MVKSKSIPGKIGQVVLCIALWANATSIPEIGGISGPSLPLLTEKLGGEKSAQTFLLDPASADSKIIRHGEFRNCVVRKCVMIPYFAVSQKTWCDFAHLFEEPDWAKRVGYDVDVIHSGIYSQTSEDRIQVVSENWESPEEHNQPLESTPTKNHTPDNDRDFTVSAIANPSHGDTNGQMQEEQQEGGADDVFIDDNTSNQDTIERPAIRTRRPLLDVNAVMELSLPDDDDNTSDRVTYDRQAHTPPDNLHLLLHSNLAINDEGHKTTTPTSERVLGAELTQATDSGHFLQHSNLAINDEGHKTTTPTSDRVLGAELTQATDSGLSQTDQRNLTCNSCSKSFKSKSGFQSHERAFKRRGSCQ